LESLIKDKSISLVLPVHNQENIIGFVIKGMIENKTENVKELIIVIDGCTDNTEREIDRVLPICGIPVKIIYTPDVWEVKASNVGYKSAECPYILTFQDDMICTEPRYDERMMKPFERFPNVFGVTGRDALDCMIDEKGILQWINLAGRDANSPREYFYIRSIINRGPVLWDHAKMEEIGYLDESFYPQGQDDTNACWIAFQKGWTVGCYQVAYDSELYWGGTRKTPEIAHWFDDVIYPKNCDIIVQRYRDLIMKPFNDQDIEMD